MNPVREPQEPSSKSEEVRESTEAPIDEPSSAELRLIEAEWPAIAADLAAVEAEIQALQGGAPVSDLELHRTRRALSRRIIVSSCPSEHLDGVA